LAKLGDNIPYEWIELYKTTGEGALKRKPINRTDALALGE